MNKYFLYILTQKKDNKIQFFQVFDFIKNLVYYGSYQIKYISEEIIYDDFFRITKYKRVTLIPINELQLNLFLNLDFSDLREITFKNFLIKYGL
jgi:hypothetical protein